MLVEDDKSLREIYGVRLLAEGYDIVTAGDGEEALAMAIKERPALIISDVMMPKISGFDMLDILRSTTETKDIKVIMMTALSSEEQRARGEKLGADRYLVKSQVGIEDVIRAVHEVLGDVPGAAPAAPAAQPANSPAAAPTATTPPQTAFGSQTAPVAPTPQQPTPPTTPNVPPPQSTVVPPTPPAPENPSAPQAPSLGGSGEKVIQPLENNPNVQKVDINELINKEIAKEADLPPSPAGSPAPGSEAPKPEAPAQPPAEHGDSIAPPPRPPVPPTQR
ncbi:response regulator [Candidatus Saccharibacteria bacterium]|nr:response regulator [Candidatus Saccharibacteria bacterium]